MVQIVTVPQTVQALTSSLGTSTSGQNSALATALVAAGILSSVYPPQAVGAVITSASALAYVNGTDAITSTPVVWVGITNPVTNYGSFNTAPISLTINGGPVSFPANSVFTFSRTVTALVTCQCEGLMSTATSGGDVGMEVWNVLSGTPYAAALSNSQTWDPVDHLTSFEDAYSCVGNYHTGDSVAVSAFTANLLSGGVTVTGAQYGELAGTMPVFSIVNFN